MVSQLPLHLLHILKREAPLAIALSGGIDSRFLLHAANLAGVPFIAIHACGLHIPQSDTARAVDCTNHLRCRLCLVSVQILDLPSVRKNTLERCYHCKKYIFQQFKHELRKSGLDNYRLCDGSNLDDATVFRPGVKALAEEDILSPLNEAGLTKAQIRLYAAKTGLDDPEQKSNPCLLTRFAYNQTIVEENLQRVADLEERVRRLIADSDLSFRLRFVPEPVLQCTKAPPARSAIRNVLHQAGLTDVRLAVTPYLSGFFDRQKTDVQSWPML